MSIKSPFSLKFFDAYVIKIQTCQITLLTLVIRILVQLHLSFLIESFHFNFGKGEVMHDEETI